MVEQIISKKAGVLKIIYNIFVITILMLVLGGAINLYFAVGYLLSILVHEAGHFYTAKFYNLKVRFGGFTPFGAFVVHEETTSVKESAIIAIAGPVFGGVFALVCYFIYLLTENNTFLVLSSISVLMNLLNLIPVKPLDGGFVAEAVSPVISYLGLPFLLYLFITSERIKEKVIVFIVLLVGTYQTYVLTKKYKEDGLYEINQKFKVKLFSFYIAFLLTLIISIKYFKTFGNIADLIRSIAKFKGVS